MSDKRIGSGPVQPEYVERMNVMARFIDTYFNGEIEPKATGFVLLVFPFGDHTESHRCNYISNAERADVVLLLKEQLSYFEGMSDKQKPGHA